MRKMDVCVCACMHMHMYICGGIASYMKSCLSSNREANIVLHAGQGVYKKNSRVSLLAKIHTHYSGQKSFSYIFNKSTFSLPMF